MATETTTAAAGYARGFTTLDDETTIERLPLRGALPEWLEGSLLRTGPARFELGGRSLNHWFDGLAMLHRFSFAGGEVSYANRYLQSRAYREARERGRQALSEFATDPCRSIFGRVQSLFQPTVTDNGNVNVGRLGDRFVAMTETPLPIEFDPATLATLGHATRSPGHVTTAHPHADRDSGEAINYVTRFGPRATYRVYGLAAVDGRPRTIAEAPASPVAYMHSFGLTERYVVLAEFPLVVRPLRLALGGATFMESFAWEPERGTTFTLLDRRDGSVRARLRAAPFFSFHHVNAFDDGEDRVVVDLCAYDDSSIVRSLFLDRLRSGTTGEVPDAHLTRCTVDLARGEVTIERRSETPLELPRIDYGRVNGQPYRWVYGAARGAGAQPGDFIDQLVKIDAGDGAATIWREPGCYPGEPVFVGAPGRTAEDDGVCLSVVLDGAAGTSFLLVLDAGSFEELARAEVPHHIPFGFHGQFARDR